MTKAKAKPVPTEPVQQTEPAPTGPERPTHINGVEVEYVKMGDSGMVLQKFVQKPTKEPKE